MLMDNNEELKLSPLNNIKSTTIGKNGWGSVTIALPNDMVTHLAMDDEYYVGGLLLASREEFDRCKKDMNRKENSVNENED